MISTEEFAEFDDVGEAFIALQTNLTYMLMKPHFPSLRRACIVQQKTPRGVKLSKQLETEIQCAQNIDMLLDTLVVSPYWSWIDVRMLQAIVRASNIPQALQILKNYKSAVFSRKLIDLLPNIPSKEIKELYYTKIVTKLEKDASNMTIADLLEFQTELETVIMDVGKGTCVLDNIKPGCIEVHWYIPTHCVDSAYQSASTRCHMFNEIHLLWLQIAHYPVIYDPLTTHAVAMPTPPPPENVGKCFIIFVLSLHLNFLQQQSKASLTTTMTSCQSTWMLRWLCS